MKMIARMIVFPKFRLKTLSLFLCLLFSFLAVILMLISFILYSLFFFHGNIKSEIIQYNKLNLNYTTESYEKQFQLIHDATLSFTLNDKIPHLDTLSFDYFAGYQLMEDLQHFLYNQSLYLDNTIIYYQTSDMTLEKSRGAAAATMFSRFYNNPDYDYAFWKTQFTAPYKFRILPAGVFSEVGIDQRKIKPRTLIPILIKNQNYPSIYLIAMADANKMYDEFHHSINENFYILDASKHPLFSTGTSPQADFPDFEQSQGFVKQGKNYYFYKKGDETGLTYVNIIPDDSIYVQLKWNLTFLLLLVISILISIAASFFFSLKFNQPVKRIVDSVVQLKSGLPRRSGIKEFNIIQDKVKDILKINQDFKQNLEEKQSLLRHYALINKMKKIGGNIDELKDLVNINKPYRLVSIKLTFKPRLYEELEVNDEKATSYVREYINRCMVENDPGSFTFQIEKDQILSVVFADKGEAALLDTLKEIKQALDLDRSYCFLTIAVSGPFAHSDDLNVCFEQVQSLLKARAFHDETQIITEMDRKPCVYILPPVQEEQIDECLSRGNYGLLEQIMKDELAQLKKQEAPQWMVNDFCADLIRRAQKALLARQSNTAILQVVERRIGQCHSYEELQQLITEWLPQLIDAIRGKREKKDYIASYVIDYLDQNYHRDISLDMLADQLKITRSYLSTYFKEKTGIYFVDYVNLVRINKAKDLLMNPSMKIQDAAAQVGYQNINSFNRMFKKFMGTTPSEFRKTESVQGSRLSQPNA